MIRPCQLKRFDLIWIDNDGLSYVGEFVHYDIQSELVRVLHVPRDRSTDGNVVPDFVYPVDITRDPINWVRYATLEGPGRLPFRALQADRAAPVNFMLIKRMAFFNGALINDDSKSISGIVVAKCTRTKYEHAWNEDVWSCNGWRIHDIRTVQILP